MAKKRVNAEQIVVLLHQIEVLTSQSSRLFENGVLWVLRSGA